MSWRLDARKYTAIHIGVIVLHSIRNQISGPFIYHLMQRLDHFVFKGGTTLNMPTLIVDTARTIGWFRIGHDGVFAT